MLRGVGLVRGRSAVYHRYRTLRTFRSFGAAAASYEPPSGFAGASAHTVDGWKRSERNTEIDWKHLKAPTSADRRRLLRSVEQIAKQNNARSQAATIEQLINVCECASAAGEHNIVYRSFNRIYGRIDSIFTSEPELAQYILELYLRSLLIGSTHKNADDKFRLVQMCLRDLGKCEGVEGPKPEIMEAILRASVENSIHYNNQFRFILGKYAKDWKLELNQNSAIDVLKLFRLYPRGAIPLQWTYNIFERVSMHLMQDALELPPNFLSSPRIEPRSDHVGGVHPEVYANHQKDIEDNLGSMIQNMIPPSDLGVPFFAAYVSVAGDFVSGASDYALKCLLPADPFHHLRFALTRMHEMIIRDEFSNTADIHLFEDACVSALDVAWDLRSTKDAAWITEMMSEVSPFITSRLHALEDASGRTRNGMESISSLLWNDELERDGADNKVLSQLASASSAPLDYLRDLARRGHSPEHLLHTVTKWEEDASFTTNAQHYTAILEAMHPDHSVHPLDAGVIVRVIEAMEVRSYRGDAAFYKTCMELVSHPRMAHREKLLALLPPSLIEYTNIISTNEDSLWSDALALYFSSKLSSDKVNESELLPITEDSFSSLPMLGHLKRMHLLCQIAEPSVRRSSSSAVAVRETVPSDVAGDFVIKSLLDGFPKIKYHDLARQQHVYQMSFEGLSASVAFNTRGCHSHYIDTYGLRRRYVWDGKNHAYVGDVDPEEKKEAATFLSQLAGRWGVLSTLNELSAPASDSPWPVMDEVPSVPLERVRQVWDHMQSNGVQANMATCTAAIHAHTNIATHHSLCLLSALSIFEHALTIKEGVGNEERSELYSAIIACAFRHDNNCVADKLLQHMLDEEVPPSPRVALTFVEHLGGRAPLSDAEQAIASYVGFTKSFGVPVSARLLDAVVHAAAAPVISAQGPSPAEEDEAVSGKDPKTLLAKALGVFKEDCDAHQIIPAKTSIFTGLRALVLLGEEKDVVSFGKWAKDRGFITQSDWKGWETTPPGGKVTPIDEPRE